MDGREGQSQSKPHSQAQSQKQRINELRAVIDNAQELLKNTGQYSSGIYPSARAKLAQALQVATDELSRFEEAQLQRMMEATAAASLRDNDCSGEARVMRAFRRMAN